MTRLHAWLIQIYTYFSLAIDNTKINTQLLNFFGGPCELDNFGEKGSNVIYYMSYIIYFMLYTIYYTYILWVIYYMLYIITPQM